METYYADKQAYPQQGDVSGAAGSAGGDFTANGQTVKLTPGNYVGVYPVDHPLPGTYCPWASAGSAGSGVFTYDSDAGGLRKLGEVCIGSPT